MSPLKHLSGKSLSMLRMMRDANNDVESDDTSNNDESTISNIDNNVDIDNGDFTFKAFGNDDQNYDLSANELV